MVFGMSGSVIIFMNMKDYKFLGDELQTLGELFLSINFEGDSNLKACYRMSLKILALYIYSVELRGVGIGIGIGLKYVYNPDSWYWS